MENERHSSEDIIADLKSRNVEKRAAALYEVLGTEDVSVDMFLEVANLLKDKSAYNPNPNQLVPPRSAAFAPGVGEVAAVVLGKLGERSSNAVKNTLKQMPEFRADRRICAMDGICAVGPTAFASALDDAQVPMGDAISVLEEILSSRFDYPRICSVAIRVLGNLGPQAGKAIPSISRFLSVTGDGFGSAAKLGGYCMVALSDSDTVHSPAKEAAAALVRIGSASLPALAIAIEDPDAAFLAIEALEKLGKMSVSLLLGGLESDSKKIRLRSADALLNIGDKSGEVLTAFAKAAEDEKSWFSRRRLRKALKKLRG